MRGEALEASVRARLGELTLGEAKIPFVMPAWNVDLNRVELLGSFTTPKLTFAHALRIAISLPIFAEPVSVGGHLYADGGIVDIFPARPVVEAGVDVVVGLNAYLPENFTGEDVTGWRQRPFGLLRASGQLRWSGMVALAREQALLAKDTLMLLHPVPYAEVRGSRFYETFVDRSKWPEFMKAGHRVARERLQQGVAPAA
jgi:NTE family protein